MKCGVDDEVRSNTSSTSDLDGEIKCPICRSKFMHIHALKYHLKTTHKKKQKKGTVVCYCINFYVFFK